MVFEYLLYSVSEAVNKAWTPARLLKKALAEASAFSGAATQIRTGDLILTKDALYLLSYSSIFDSFDIITRKFPCVNYFFSKTATFFATKNV